MKVSVCLCLVLAVVNSPAQTFNTLVDFNNSNGASPYFASLVQGSGGNLYGTTEFGGSGNASHGTAFRVTPGGDLTTIYSFCIQADCADGAYPFGGLVLGDDGSIYGTTFYGGKPGCGSGIYSDCGVVFKISRSGQLTVIYDFCSKSDCADGSNPYAGVVQGADGNLYGTTYYGSTGTCDNGDAVGCGMIFELSPTGMLQTLHSFNSEDDGAYPRTELIQGNNGSFYGTTEYGVCYMYVSSVKPKNEERPPGRAAAKLSGRDSARYAMTFVTSRHSFGGFSGLQ